MAVSELSSGLILFEDFESYPLGVQPVGWTNIQLSGSHSFTVENAPTGMSGKALRGAENLTGDAVILNDGVGNLLNGVIQVKVRLEGTSGEDNSTGGVIARWVSNGNKLLANVSSFRGSSGAFEGYDLFTSKDGVNILEDHVVDIQPNSNHILRLSVQGDQGVYRAFDSSGTFVTELNLTLTQLDPGLWGFFASGVRFNRQWWDDLAIFKNTTIEVSGLPVGYKIEENGEVAVESSGTALLDYSGLFPLSGFNILNKEGDVIDRFVGEVWGGDSYFVSDIRSVDTFLKRVSGDVSLERYKVVTIESFLSSLVSEAVRTNNEKTVTSWIRRIQSPFWEGQVKVWNPHWDPCYQDLNVDGRPDVGQALVAPHSLGLLARVWQREEGTHLLIDETLPVTEEYILSNDGSDLLPPYGGVFWNAVISGWLLIETEGYYRLRNTVDDIVRLYLDGEFLGEAKIGQSTNITTNYLNSGYHSLRMEHIQHTTVRFLTFEWEPPGTSGFVPVPAENLILTLPEFVSTFSEESLCPLPETTWIRCRR